MSKCYVRDRILLTLGRYEHERESGTMLHLLVEKTVVRLETWKTNLHPYLQINLDEEATVTLPHVILLQYAAQEMPLYIAYSIPVCTTIST